MREAAGAVLRIRDVSMLRDARLVRVVVCSRTGADARGMIFGPASPSVEKAC